MNANATDLRTQLNDKASEQTRLHKSDTAQAEMRAREIRRLIAEHELIRWKLQIANPRATALTQPQPLSADVLGTIIIAPFSCNLS